MKALQTKKTKWNLKPLFKSDNDPLIKAERKKVEKESYRFINKWKDKQDYLEDPKVLKKALDEYEYWAKYFGTSGNQGYYFSLRSAQDQTNPKLKAKLNKINDFAIKIQNDIQFFPIRIAKIPPKDQKKFLKYKGLNEYKHFLEKLFEGAKYILSEDEEKIMNLKAKTSHSNWVRMTSEFISKEQAKVPNKKGKKEIKTFEELLTLTNNPNKKIRKAAAKELERIFEKNLDVAEIEINSVLENKKVNDELRKYKRPDTARHLVDDIESDVVDTLVSAVTKRSDISKKYYKIKTKLLKLRKLEYCERNVEVGKIEKKYKYETAINLIYNAFNRLDPQFAQILESYINNGQIDVFPQKGKMGGAFCSYAGTLNPTYILLNYTNQLNDILAIAHELGHGINNELIKEKQNEINFGTPLSTAEVASTFMEDFVVQELISTVDNKTKLAIMMSKLNSDISSIHRQIAFYKFEQDLHKKFRIKGYLPKQEIGKLFKKHMANYMGDVAKGSDNWWIYVSHFRRFFYVYSYASGLLISKSLQNSVKKNPKFINKVKEFLSAGLSAPPKDIFAKLGIDISNKRFWNKGLDEMESLLDDTWTLAKKLGKI